MCKCVYCRAAPKIPNGETHTKLALLHILYIPLDALRGRLGYIFSIFRNGGGLENSVTLWNRFPNLASKSMTKRLTDAPVPLPTPAPDNGPEVLSTLCIVFAMFDRIDECRCGGTGAFCCRDVAWNIRSYLNLVGVLSCHYNYAKMATHITWLSLWWRRRWTGAMRWRRWRIDRASIQNNWVDPLPQ